MYALSHLFVRISETLKTCSVPQHIMDNTEELLFLMIFDTACEKYLVHQAKQKCRLNVIVALTKMLWLIQRRKDPRYPPKNMLRHVRAKIEREKGQCALKLCQVRLPDKPGVKRSYRKGFYLLNRALNVDNIKKHLQILRVENNAIFIDVFEDIKEIPELDDIVSSLPHVERRPESPIPENDPDYETDDDWEENMNREIEEFMKNRLF